MAALPCGCRKYLSYGSTGTLQDPPAGLLAARSGVPSLCCSRGGRANGQQSPPPRARTHINSLQNRGQAVLGHSPPNTIKDLRPLSPPSWMGRAGVLCESAWSPRGKNCIVLLRLCCPHDSSIKTARTRDKIRKPELHPRMILGDSCSFQVRPFAQGTSCWPSSAGSGA